MAFLGLIPEYQSDVQLRLTPEEAKKEAAGRALTLMGSVIGMVGGVMVLSVNPAFKQQAKGAWKEMPPEVQQNKTAVIIGGSLVLASIAYYGFKKKTARRYGAT